MKNEKEPEAATYLGDGVYASIEYGQISLTTQAGTEAGSNNRIYLEPQVLDALNEYAKKMRDRQMF